MLERVFELSSIRSVRESETRQIRSDDVIAVPQERDQVPEHVGRRRKAVQEHKGGSFGVAGLPIEDVDAVDFDGAVTDLIVTCIHRSHWGLSFFQQSLMSIVLSILRCWGFFES